MTEIETECRNEFSALGYNIEADSGDAEEEVKKRAEQLLTVREEWDALGFDLDEEIEDKDNSGRSEKFDGDVTLF